MRRAAASLDLGGSGQAVLFARKACNIPQGAPADFVRSALVASFTLAVSWQSPQLRQHIRRAGQMALGDTQDRERGEEGFSQPLSVLGFTPHATTAQPNGYLEELGQGVLEKYRQSCVTTIPLHDIMDFGNGYAFKSGAYVQNGPYKVLTIKNVQDGSVDCSTSNRIDELPPKMKSYCKLHPGDVVLSLTGNVGRVGIVAEKTACLTNVLQFFNLTIMPCCQACISTSGKGLFKMK